MKIGHFSVMDNGEKVVVNYRIAAKILITGIVYMVLGSWAFFLAYIAVKYMAQVEVTWYLLLFALAFAIVALYQIGNGISLIFRPIKEIVVIDRRLKIVKVRRTLFSTLIYPYSEIKKVLLQGKTEKVAGTGLRGALRIFCTISFQVGTEETHVMFVNSIKIFNSEEQSRTEIYTTGKKIARVMASEIGVRFEWKGFQ